MPLSDGWRGRTANDVQIRQVQGTVDGRPREIVAHTAMRTVQAFVRQHILVSALDLLQTAVARMTVTKLPREGVFVLQDGLITKAADTNSDALQAEPQLRLDLPDEADKSLPGQGRAPNTTSCAAPPHASPGGWNVVR